MGRRTDGHARCRPTSRTRAARPRWTTGTGSCSATAAAGVLLVTGDTKVVDRGKCDGVFITTAGIGFVPDEVALSIRNARPGDRVLVSGTLGDHGIAVMSVREGLEFETVLESDTA